MLGRRGRPGPDRAPSLSMSRLAAPRSPAMSDEGLIQQWCTGCGAQMHEGEPLHKVYDPGHRDYPQRLADERRAALAARSEPRGEGLQELAAEIGATWNDQTPGLRSVQTADGLILIIGPIAATPPAPALDVERLAVALRILPSPMHDQVGHDQWRRGKAEAIAREYAALAPERQEAT